MVSYREVLWVQIRFLDNHIVIHRFVGEVMMNDNLVVGSNIQPRALKLIIFLKVKEFTIEVKCSVIEAIWATIELHQDFIAQKWLDSLQRIVLRASDSSRSARSIWLIVRVITLFTFSSKAYAIWCHSLVSLKTFFNLKFVVNAQTFISMSMERYSLKFTSWWVVKALIFVPELVRKDIVHWSMHVQAKLCRSSKTSSLEAVPFVVAINRVREIGVALSLNRSAAVNSSFNFCLFSGIYSVCKYLKVANWQNAPLICLYLDNPSRYSSRIWVIVRINASNW